MLQAALDGLSMALIFRPFWPLCCLLIPILIWLNCMPLCIIFGMQRYCNKNLFTEKMNARVMLQSMASPVPTLQNLAAIKRQSNCTLFGKKWVVNFGLWTQPLLLIACYCCFISNRYRTCRSCFACPLPRKACTLSYTFNSFLKAGH